MDAKTIARTVILVLALVNQGLSLFGFNPIPVDEEAIYQFISLLVLGVASIMAWHKNNPTSKAGKKAQQDLKRYKAEQKEDKILKRYEEDRNDDFKGEIRGGF